MPANPNIFGIRHHGPGSARSLRAALEKLKPDCLLIEGPPDADDLIALAGHKDFQPPVALLVYDAEKPTNAVYYPFAVFSPEWQAIQYGLRAKIPVRFMDLPQAHRMAEKEEEKDDEPAPNEPPPTEPLDEPQLQFRLDPLSALAKAAGYDDSERWWGHFVEERQSTGDGDVFAAVLEAMTALRDAFAGAERPEDLLREAHMRQTIRAAQKEGHENIAVVCGAFHAPALHATTSSFSRDAKRSADDPARTDAALLKDLPKTNVKSTWIPWTHGRLTFASGYGAGVRSPGWYHHLWSVDRHVVPRWLTKVARLLRDEDIDCSSAHVIESVRLAETLAHFRGRRLPGLDELNEACRSVFLFDSDAPMQLIARKLIVGEKLGEVPDDVPSVPLQQDLQREQKRLRLPPDPTDKSLELDLRKETDLDRSRLLHRLNLLGIPWGKGERATGKGTFKEAWRIKWEPEYAVRVIEAGAWGNTVPAAAAQRAVDLAAKAPDLPALSKLVDAVLLADLPATVDPLMRKLETEAAVAADVGQLMDALPPLAQVSRYGNVRQTDTAAVGHVVAGLVARVCIGLPGAAASLNDDAAAELFKRIGAVQGAVSLLQNDEHTAAWQGALRALADSENLHGLIAGRASRLLLDAGAIAQQDAARKLSLALSAASDPAHAAAWVEGFLAGSGLLLLHDEGLWSVIDDWVIQLNADTFQQVLPLLRRTFGTFAAPERRQMGERVKRGRATGASPSTRAATTSGDNFDTTRADATLPTLRLILGLP